MHLIMTKTTQPFLEDVEQMKKYRAAFAKTSKIHIFMEIELQQRCQEHAMRKGQFLW